MRTVITLDTDVRPWDPPAAEARAPRRKSRGGGAALVPLLFFALLCVGATVFGVYALRGPSPQREASATGAGLPPAVSEAAVEEGGNGNLLPSSAGIEAAGRPGWVAVLFNDQLTLTPCCGAYTVFDGGGNVLAAGDSTADGPLYSVTQSAGVVCHE